MQFRYDYIFMCTKCTKCTKVNNIKGFSWHTPWHTGTL